MNKRTFLKTAAALVTAPFAALAVKDDLPQSSVVEVDDTAPDLIRISKIHTTLYKSDILNNTVSGWKDIPDDEHYPTRFIDIEQEFVRIVRALSMGQHWLLYDINEQCIGGLSYFDDNPGYYNKHWVPGSKDGLSFRRVTKKLA